MYIREDGCIMKITALTENTSADPRFGAEHGLSLYIEANGHRILFDSGQTELFERNASLLGIDLAGVDIAVLSHGHYDHSGGLKRFLELNDSAPVYLHRLAFEPHYNAEGKYIGLDESLRDSRRLIFTDDVTELGDGLTLYSCNNEDRPYDFGSQGLSVMRDGVLLPDDFAHEQYLLINEGGRRVLISGCSHKGILNIEGWFKPDVLIGGFHFMKQAPDDGLRRWAEELDKFDTEYYTCHCTGTAQYAYLKRYMRRLSYLSAGETVEV